MKKYISAPLCSAFIIPGLGQIINQELKKGIILLATVFILFLAGTVKLYMILSSVIRTEPGGAIDIIYFRERFGIESFSFLYVVIILFVIIWVYSIVDAYMTGKRLEDK